MRPGITACIPVHEPRLTDGSLRRAVESVLDQDYPAAAIAVAVDATGRGAAATRQRALDMVDTEWVAFLDADDRWYSYHLATLADLADDAGADYVYSWFDGNMPFAEATHRGRPMNPDEPHHTTMTVMVRTELAKAVGFTPHPAAHPDWPGEDWQFTLGCILAGARFAGTGDITWHYTADNGNTSGLGWRWAPRRPQVDVTVVTPHIPPRRGELLRALDSIAVQSSVPAAWSTAVDHEHAGSAAIRNRALAAASTRWVAFLDDDDAFEIGHLGALAGHADATGADVVYSGCTVVGPDGVPVPDREEWGRFGLPFDENALRDHSWLPVTALVRTDLAKQVGGFRRPAGSPYDDWGLWLALLDAGARFEHLPQRTWCWHHHGRNTSGLPERW